MIGASSGSASQQARTSSAAMWEPACDAAPSAFEAQCSQPWSTSSPLLNPVTGVVHSPFEIPVTYFTARSAAPRRAAAHMPPPPHNPVRKSQLPSTGSCSREEAYRPKLSRPLQLEADTRRGKLSLVNCEPLVVLTSHDQNEPSLGVTLSAAVCHHRNRKVCNNRQLLCRRCQWTTGTS